MNQVVNESGQLVEVVLDGLDIGKWRFSDFDEFERQAGFPLAQDAIHRLKENPKWMFLAVFLQNRRQLGVSWEWWTENISVEQIIGAIDDDEGDDDAPLEVSG